MSFAKYPVSGGAGSSTVTGPATSTNNGVVLFNGTTGNVVKDLGVGSANQVLVTDGTTPSFSLIGTANIASPNQLITNGTQTIDGNKQFTGATQLGPTPAFTGSLRQVVNTGLQGATAVFNASEAGRIQFANVTGSATNPCIIGTSNSTGGSGFGLGIYALTNDGNTVGDMIFDARENDSTVHATTTNLAFSFRYFNTPFLRIRRDSLITLGSDTFTGTHVINGGFSATQPITLSAASNQIVLSSGTNQLTLNSGTSGAARTYDIPNVGATGTFMMLEGLQTVAGTKIFSQPITIQQAGNQLVLGSSTTTTINATTPAANRIYTIPDAGAAANFIMSESTQTINGAKTFTSALTLNAASNQLVLSSGVNQLTLNGGTSTATRIYTVPDVGGTAQFVMTAGTQNSIGGDKTFTSLLTASAGLTVSGGSAANLSLWSASNVLNLRGGTSGLDIYNTSGTVVVDVTDAGAVTLGPSSGSTLTHVLQSGGDTQVQITSAGASNEPYLQFYRGATYDAAIAVGSSSNGILTGGTAGELNITTLGSNRGINFSTDASTIQGKLINGAWTLGPSAGLTSPHVIQKNHADSATAVYSQAFLKLKMTSTVNNTGVCAITLPLSTTENYGFSLSSVRTTTGAAGDLQFRIHDNSDVGVVIGKATSLGAWTIGATSGTQTHILNGLLNFDSNQGTNASYALTMRKDATGTGADVNYFMSFGVAGTYSNSGRISSNGANACNFFGTSDRRLKEDIHPLNDGLNKINQLNPVHYRWKESGVSEVGFIAQEVHKVLPHVVGVKDDGLGDELLPGQEPWTMTDGGPKGFLPYLVKAIQELSTKLDSMKLKIKQLEGK